MTQVVAKHPASNVSIRRGSDSSSSGNTPKGCCEDDNSSQADQNGHKVKVSRFCRFHHGV